MRKSNICVLTATRAEYGLLKDLIGKLFKEEDFNVKIAVTGMHLSSEFGLTYTEILNDGFEIDTKIEMLLSSDSACAVSKSMGLALIGFADYFERNHFDLLVVLGDRYETLAVCLAAMNSKIPIAHIHGGEITEGAIDDMIRHSITKLSSIHFTTTEEYRRRVIQLGELPQRVFNVGSLGVEAIRKLKLMEKEQLGRELNVDLEKNYALMTYHPVTLDEKSVAEEFQIIIDALEKYLDLNIIITKANADSGGRIINAIIDKLGMEKPDKYRVFASLGQLRYLSVMKYCKFVIGNSSSGIIEAPSLNKWCINIGDRQKGRISAPSTLHCKNDVNEIGKCIEYIMKQGTPQMANPYEKEGTAEEIVKNIKEYLNTPMENIQKRFYDIEYTALRK